MRLPATRRPRWRTLLLVLSVFIAGAVAGSGFTVGFAIHRVQYAIHHPEEAPDRITKALRRQLKLDDRQAAQVRAIVVERQASLQGIRREFQPRVEQELDVLRDKISAILNDSQKQALGAFAVRVSSPLAAAGSRLGQGQPVSPCCAVKRETRPFGHRPLKPPTVKLPAIGGKCSVGALYHSSKVSPAFSGNPRMPAFFNSRANASGS